jgi:hypothetical protein
MKNGHDVVQQKAHSRTSSLFTTGTQSQKQSLNISPGDVAQGGFGEKGLKSFVVSTVHFCMILQASIVVVRKTKA